MHQWRTHYQLLLVVLLSVLAVAVPRSLGRIAESPHSLPPLVRHAPVNQPKAVGRGTPVGSNVNVSQLFGNEAEVSIDVNPTNPDNQVIFGHGPNVATINAFYTFDGGQTWTLVPIGSSDDGLPGFLRGDPSVVFDDDGNLYVGYGVRWGPPNRITVVVGKSTDGGQSFSQFTYVHTNPDIGTIPGNDKWHLATGPDDVNPSQQNVYVAWMMSITEPQTIDQRVVIAKSTDGGASFSLPLIINDASLGGTSPGNVYADPAVGPNGEVYVTWWSVGTQQILFDYAPDGVSFGTDVEVSTSQTGFRVPIPAQPDRGVFAGPVADTDRSGGAYDGRVYVSYTDIGVGGLPNIDVLLRHSDDNGATWSSPILVHDDGGLSSQFLSWVDVDQQTGMVGVAWYDTRNDLADEKVEVFLAASDDGGVSFNDNVVLSDGQSDQSASNPFSWAGNYLEYIGVAIHGGEAFAVWADNSTDLSDLDFFTGSHIVTTTAVDAGSGAPGEAGSGRLRLCPSSPNPFRGSTQIRFDLASAGAVQLTVYDVQGRAVRELLESELRPAGPQVVAWDGRDGRGVRVPAGVYYYRVEAAGISLTQKLTIVP